MLTSLVLWVHDVVANSGMVDRFMSGDTSLSATLGVLVGGVIGWDRLNQRRND